MKSKAYLIMSPQNEVLASSGHGLWGAENLRKSIQTVNQFFNLESGDAVLLNDPSCGGLFAWAMTCVQKYDQYIIAQSLRVQTPWSLSPKIDSEGLRIPPTPFIQKGEIQSQILEGISSHPLAGPHLTESLKKLISIDDLPFKNQLGKINLKKSIPLKLKELLRDLPHSDTTCELKISTHEILKLKMQTDEHGFVFNFTGTSNGLECFMNESLISGLCREFILSFYNLDSVTAFDLDPYIHFILPQSSFLQAKFPQGQLQGLARGTGCVLQALQKCFQQVYPREFIPFHNFFPLWIQVKNKNKLAQWIIPNGSGALDKEVGISAFSISQIEDIPSIESLQDFFEIQEFTPRPLKVQGKYNAGSGLQIDLVVKTDCEILWLFEDSLSVSRGDNKHSTFEACAVKIDGQEQKSTGTIQLKIGQTLSLQTGSGSSFQ